MQSPVKKIFITQKFGANPSSYSKFGLKGHNGIDYRAFLPNGERCHEGGKSEVFAPHDGKIIENTLDAKGYGWYVKIENTKEGSVLGHFSAHSPCKIGTMVKEGQLIGYQGTTGNSTGIHLHWGYYKIPRDRANGYAGFINQEGLYKPFNQSMPENTQADKIEIEKKLFEELVSKATKYDNFKNMGFDNPETVKVQLDTKDKDIASLQDQNTRLNNQLAQVKTQLSGSMAETTKWKQDYQKFIDEVAVKVGSPADEANILKRLEMDIQEMDDITKKAGELEKSLIEVENKNKAEIEALKAEISQKTMELEAMQRQYSNLLKRVEELEADKPVIENTNKFIKFLKDLLKI